MDNNRSVALLTLLNNGLVKDAGRISLQLGNRSEYIGVSDIAAYVSCQRKAVLNKIKPTPEDLTTMLTFQRGHWVEDGIANAFEANGRSINPPA